MAVIKVRTQFEVRSCNCSSRQRCTPRQPPSAPGASKTGIGTRSQNGFWRSGALPWIHTSAASPEAPVSLHGRWGLVLKIRRMAHVSHYGLLLETRQSQIEWPPEVCVKPIPGDRQAAGSHRSARRVQAGIYGVTRNVLMLVRTP